MKITKFALKNPQFTIVVIVLLVVVGVVSYFTMPRSEDPQLNFAASNIIVVYPGASPKDVEEMIVDPMEDAINELDDIDKISSVMEEGLAIVDVQFEPWTDPDDKYQKLITTIERVRAKLPRDISYIDILQYSPSTVNILQMALTSEVCSYRELEKHAEELKKRFARIPGIRKTEVHACPQQQVAVYVDPIKIEALQLSQDEISQSVLAAGSDIPGGYVSAGPRRFTIRTSGPYKSLDDIRKTIIRADNNGIVHLGDIASVSLSVPDTLYRARVNGAPAVFVTVQQKDNTNILSIVKTLHQEIKKFRAELNPGMELTTVYDQSIGVDKRINSFFTNLFQGIIIVGLVVLLFLGFRSSLIVVSVIPASIFIAIGWLDLSWQGLNQISIVGFVVALGLFVDNAIVVVETIVRNRKTCSSIDEAVLSGMSEIGWPVVSSTITTVLAFLPIVMLNSITGQFIRSLPLSIIYALMASLIVSLVFTPLLTKKLVGRVSNKKINAPFAQRMLERFGERYFKPVLQFAVSHPFITITTATLLFLGSLIIFPNVGVSLFPKAEIPLIRIDIKTPEGSEIGYTNGVTREVEKICESENLIDISAANVGKGNPRVYYNIASRRESANIAQVLAHLKTTDRNFVDSLTLRLRDKFSGIVGAEIEIKEFEQGTPIVAPIALRVVGNDLDSISKYALEIEKISKNADGTINVGNSVGKNRTDIKVEFDREKAALLGVPPLAGDKAVRAYTAGMKITTMRENSGDDYDVNLFFRSGTKRSLNDLQNITVTSLTKKQVPLGQVSSISLESGPTAINHYMLERTAMVTADVLPGFTVDKVTQNILGKVNKINPPQGVRLVMSGELESRQDSFAGMNKAFLAAGLMVMAVLVLQFRSFYQMIIVISAVPFAIIGALAGLYITGLTFSFTAFVGLTGLIGMVVNDSIILIDYANQLVRQGKTIREAITESSITRLTPVWLTTLTTIGGLLPLLFTQSTLWRPMAVVMIGGSITATTLILMVVPVLYNFQRPRRVERS